MRLADLRGTFLLGCGDLLRWVVVVLATSAEGDQRKKALRALPATASHLLHVTVPAHGHSLDLSTS